MTEHQIEVAARKLCELRGIDPNQSVAHGAEPDERGFVPAVCLYSPAWRLVAREVRAHWQMQMAISVALDDNRAAAKGASHQKEDKA